MARLGFTDCWAELGRPGLVGTCRSVVILVLVLSYLPFPPRFSTHIDYVFANKTLLEGWECTEVLHVDSNASDHRPVLARFTKK